MSAEPPPPRGSGHGNRPSEAPKKETRRGESASAQATKRARDGEPLRAENPQQRSPKQENL